MLPETNCIIIDDEPKAIELLKERLEILFPDIRITGTYTEWKKGLETLKSQPVDLVFLDVSMPEKSGIDFLKLFPTLPFHVIFVTAHSEFALQAIKFSAVGYVLKPVDDYELSFAVNKALERIKEATHRNQASPAVHPASATHSNTIKIGIPNIKGIDYLNADEILYFESVNKYTKVVTRANSIMSSYNLGEFKKIIDGKIFFQVHRSYIVNLHHIKRYEISGMLIMDDNMQIPVSKTTRPEFINMFNTISRTAGFKHRDMD